MMLAHGEQALAQVVLGVLLIFGVPALAALFFHRRPLAAVLALWWICLSLSALLLYLILRHE